MHWKSCFSLNDTQLVVGLKASCPRVGPGPIGGVPSVGAKWYTDTCTQILSICIDFEFAIDIAIVFPKIHFKFKLHFLPL